MKTVFRHQCRYDNSLILNPEYVIQQNTMLDQYLFVYGTLRHNSDNKMSQLLRSQSCYIGKATYQGKLYQVKDYPGAIASKNSDDKVQGEVYQLIKAEDLLAQLDDYEECGEGFPQPTEYIRCKKTVQLQNGFAITAWIYLFNRPTAELKRICAGDFYPS